MNSFLDLILYRHRRFKGETYFRNHFPFMLLISVIFAIFLTNSIASFIITVGFFILIDILLALGAWLYYKTDL